MGVLRSARAHLSAKPPAEVRSYALFAVAGPLVSGVLIAAAVAVLGAELPDPIQTGYANPRRGRYPESSLTGYAVFAVLFGAALTLIVWTMVANFSSMLGPGWSRSWLPVAALLAWGLGGSLARNAAVNLIANLGSTAAVPGLLMALNGWLVTLACGLLAALVVWIGVRRRS